MVSPPSLPLLLLPGQVFLVHSVLVVDVLVQLDLPLLTHDVAG